MLCQLTSPTIPLTSPFETLKVLFQYYPEILVTNPAVGRQGKALRRQQNRRALDSDLHVKGTLDYPLSVSQRNCKKNVSWMTKNAETEVTLSEKQKGDIFNFSFFLLNIFLFKILVTI